MLTDKQLKALKAGRSIYEVADRQGLSVRVSRGGSVTFQYRYRIGGKPERLRLGRYPEMSLAEAREAHQKARKLVDQGISPIRERTERQESEERARREAAGSDTVAGIAEEFMARDVEPNRKRPEYVREMLDRDILRALGTMKANTVTRRDVIHMLDRIVDRGARVQANRTLAVVKQMFQFAVERGIIDANPCADIRRRTVGGTEKPRERHLSHDEIRSLWHGLDRLSEPSGASTKPAPGRKLRLDEKKASWLSKPMATALKLLLATGQRRGELVKAQWSHVDADAAMWTIPAEHAKNGRAHHVPLSPLALALFQGLRQLAGDSPFVLPAYNGDRPVTERTLTKAAERIQGHVTSHVDGKATPIEKWTPHDLRRTAATRLNEVGVAPTSSRRYSTTRCTGSWRYTTITPIWMNAAKHLSYGAKR